MKQHILTFYSFLLLEYVFPSFDKIDNLNQERMKKTYRTSSIKPINYMECDISIGVILIHIRFNFAMMFMML